MMKSIYENIYTSQQLDEISNMVFRSNLSEEVPIIDPVDEINDVGFSVPNILVSTKLVASYLTQDKAVSLKREEYLGRMYGTLIDESMFACYKVITPDKYGDIIRYYIVPKLW